MKNDVTFVLKLSQNLVQERICAYIYKMYTSIVLNISLYLYLSLPLSLSACMLFRTLHLVAAKKKTLFIHAPAIDGKEK